MMIRFRLMSLFFGMFFLSQILFTGFPHSLNKDQNLDERVKNFLEAYKHQWRDMNVSEVDGRILYDIVIKNKYRKALEIGTSTGHSAIWIAWALSKTGGRLITIEINERRYRQAVTNFEEAGLSAYIDARLADAHELVPKLEGSFDFVFCDADKGWYKNYLIEILPKLKVGGCFTAHNVRGYQMRGIREFLEYLESLPYMETTIDNTSWSGISISYKRSDGEYIYR
ncbi:MAG: O-methyltransferase [Candidatus Aminicenantales bacterium]